MSKIVIADEGMNHIVVHVTLGNPKSYIDLGLDMAKEDALAEAYKELKEIKRYAHLCDTLFLPKEKFTEREVSFYIQFSI